MTKKAFQGRRADERGATFILTAIAMVLLLWAGATGVDMGFTVYGSRQAQAMADTAALDLARYLNYADSLTSISGPNGVQAYLNGKLAKVLTDNGSNAQLTVVPGYYASGHFTADGPHNSCQPVIAPPIPYPGCNAIEVTANQSVPQIFFGGFNALNGHAGNTAAGSVSGSSIASQTPEAGFSIGTYLLNVNTQASVLSKVLGPINSNINITAVGFQGLETSYVTLAQLISANTTVLSPTNIMTANLTAAQWGTAYLNAVGNAYGVSSTQYTALQGLGLSNSTSTQIPLCNLVNINVGSTQYNCSNSSISTQGLNASVNVLQMLTTEAELADGTNGIDVTSALNLTGGPLNIGNVMVGFSAITPAQVAYGPIGTTASDEQVAVTLSMNLSVPILGTPLGTLSIPLSAASGTTTLNTMTCNGNSLFSMALSTSTTAASTGANGISLTLLGIKTAQGSLSISGVTGKGSSFTGPANPPATIPPTVATETATPTPTNPETVAGTTSPTLTFTNNGGILPSVASLLSTGSVLADAIQPLMQALGVSAAGAQVAGLSANCGPVSLVQ